MKTKTFATIVGGMIFVMATVTGLAVMGILYVANQQSDDTARQREEPISEDVPDADLSTVYIWDGRANTVVMLDLETGNRDVQALVSQSDSYIIQPRISDDGTYAAFCQNIRSGDTISDIVFTVHNLRTNQMVFTESFGLIAGCEAGAFNQDGTQVTVGVVHNNPIMGVVNFPDMPDWALCVYDVSTGNITQEFNADNPSAPDFATLDDDYWFEPNISPMLRGVAFVDDTIYLTAHPFVGRDAAFRHPAYTWNVGTNEWTFLEGLTHIGADLLAQTGEVVYPYLDENYDYATPPGPSPRANTVRVDDNGTQRTIYRNTEVIMRTQFINSGSHVLLTLVPNFDYENPDPDSAGATNYAILDREGNITRLSNTTRWYQQSSATADGYISFYFNQTEVTNSMYNLVHTRIEGDTISQTLLWTHAPDLNRASYSFLWSAPMPVRDNLAPFAHLN
ncbi:MAG: hypothetical protein AAFR81_28720 [Chloroflexota bacterium]